MGRFGRKEAEMTGNQNSLAEALRAALGELQPVRIAG